MPPPAASYQSVSMRKRASGGGGGGGNTSNRNLNPERKKAVDSALGKFLDEGTNADNDEFQVLSKSNHRRRQSNGSAGFASPRKASGSTTNTSGTGSGTSRTSPRGSSSGGTKPSPKMKRRPSAAGNPGGGAGLRSPASTDLSVSEHNTRQTGGVSSKRPGRSARASAGRDGLGASGHSRDGGRTSRARSASRERPRSASRERPRSVSRDRGRSARGAPRTAHHEDEQYGEQGLNDDADTGGGSYASRGGGGRGRDVRTGRKKTLKERAQSPGPMMKKRSGSVGALSRKRAESPGPMKHRPVNAAPTIKKRSGSVGAVSRKRGDNLGPLKKRTSSPGALARRKVEPQKMRSERLSRPNDNDGQLGNLLGQVGGAPKKKVGARSVASAPVIDRRQAAQKRPSIRSMKKDPRPLQRPAKPENGTPHPPVRTKSADYDWQGFRPSDRNLDGGSSHSRRGMKAGGAPAVKKTPSDRRPSMSKMKRSFSAAPGAMKPGGALPNVAEESEIDQNEIARQKVKRNHSIAVDNSGSGSPNPGKGDDQSKKIQRAQSMMLHREMTRRGKSNSLMDLVQYKEEEIHSTSYFASNHVLINRERMKRGLRPLTRDIAMDDLARKSAQQMADSNGLNPLKTTYVGNVLRGDSIRAIHRSVMQQKQGRERANLLNPYYQDFGVGTAKGSDGQLYMCQLFSERLELALTDTAG
mmetsp:Transcript_15533/g.38698  ORF Transcript_15533/g.38698 Transcript_15533/m.38698 type:complete len:698 (-) Transcript_15533:262-2355(-)